MLFETLKALGICFIPLITLCFLHIGLHYSGVILCMANTPVPFLLGTVLWLRSEQVARAYVSSVGHHCSYKERLPVSTSGPSRVSPVLPAILSLIMFLFTFWHLLAVVLLILWTIAVK
ncbi:uncharacterized protein TM35_000361930 [Trypanosoma theileri]|uniref:Uncharacterized protein n=1 Tax=Trypanosoma theileri TaxID=67003 RepID=A0A1X0NLJ4_9TRYP|nr:uncharacterized protein TM35_000361930 [Trypanosoma theileri]ORC85333.1 hypothetical protein TM35_000361930 [Trypanosoma theileri]